MNAILAETPSQLNFTDQKIQSFGNLQRGWHFGGGVAPQMPTIETALVLNRALLRNRLLITNAFPGISGEILVTGRSGSTVIELTIEPESGITLVREVADEEVFYQEGLTLEDAVKHINSLRGESWALSGLYIGTTTTQTPDRLRALLSSHQAMAQEFQLLTKIAYTRQARATVTISKGTIEMSPVARQSSGLSLTGFCRPSVNSFSAALIQGMTATTISEA